MLKSKLDTEKLTVQLGLLFSKLGISPNTWTFLALFLAVCGFLSLAICQDLVKALGFFVLAGFLDMVDGAVARVTGRASALGAFLDGVVDRYVELLLYLGLLLYGINAAWISLLIFGAFMPSYVRAYADHKRIITDKNEQKKMGGLLERAERLILVYIGMFLGIFNFIFLEYMIILTTLLANFTAFQRIWFIWKHRE
jgi:phosphatidylglycerophosphate synthase